MKNRLLVLVVWLLLPLASVKAQIVNGGFETGDLTGWTSSGAEAAQVLPNGNLGPITPSEGIFFALVGNGPGDIDNDGLPDLATLTSAPFTVTSNTVLSFSWDFLTAEFTGIDSDPNRLDAFEIALLPELGSPIVIVSGNVEVSQPFSLIDDGSAVSSPDGSAFFERLGFQTLNSLVSSGTYSLRFSVMDAGDGSFDSALVVDSITFSAGAVSAPEPQTLRLLLLGIISAVICYERRRVKLGPLLERLRQANASDALSALTCYGFQG